MTMRDVAFLFAGQGSQLPGMGRDLCGAFALARETFEEAGDVLGFDLAACCFEGPAERLRRPSVARPAVCATSVAALRVLQAETGARAACVAGHSAGEYTALIAAGVLSFADMLPVVRAVGEAMEGIPGRMAAIVGLGRGRVEELCRQAAGGAVLCVSNHNGPTQTVVSGEPAAVERAAALARQAGARAVVPLEVATACHSPLMAPVAPVLSAALGRVVLADPTVPVVSNVGAEICRDRDRVLPLLLRHLVEPVEWEGSMRRLIAAGTELFVEVGSPRLLSGLGRAIDRTRRFLAVASPADLPEVERALGAGPALAATPAA
jgi:[acyl-carrier-protein] S-malonyltransferase